MVRCALLLVALVWASPGLAQQAAGFSLSPQSKEPQLALGGNSFALPVIDYQAPDGSWRRGSGIIVGREISPNATVGIGFFKMTPKHQDKAVPTAEKSRKISLGFSLRF